MNSDKKSGNILLIVITVLLIVLIGIGGVLIYQNLRDDRQVTNEDSSENKKEEDNDSSLDQEKTVVKDLSLNSTVVQELSSLFYNKYNNADTLSDLDGYDNYFYLDSKFDVSSLTNEFKLWMVLKKNDFPTSIEEYDLKEKFYSIFGDKVVYTHLEKINSKGGMVFYSYKDGTYYKDYLNDGIGNDAICGGSRSKLLTAQEIIENNITRIEITEAVAFEKCPFADSIEDDSISEFYKDYNNSEFVEQYKNKNNPLDEHPEKYAQYKYTFVKDSNDIYAFTSVERIK